MFTSDSKDFQSRRLILPVPCSVPKSWLLQAWLPPRGFPPELVTKPTGSVLNWIPPSRTLDSLAKFA